MVQLKTIQTEQRNPATLDIDRADTAEILRLMNAEDQKVASAVGEVLEQITKAVDLIYRQVHGGGRLVYCGCGTSGRLGVLDASECPPTFGVEPGRVTGIIAGGPDALTNAAEGAEDHFAAGEADLRAIGFGAKDALVGIAASGRTPYVLGRLRDRYGGGCGHCAAARAGGGNGLYPAEERHGAKISAEHALHRDDDQDGQGIQQFDGGRVRQ